MHVFLWNLQILVSPYVLYFLDVVSTLESISVTCISNVRCASNYYQFDKAH
jgi:hypothetical protein